MLRELTPAQLAKFTRLDYERDMAFIAVREMTGETVGVGRLMRGDDPLVGEFAVVVQPDMQGKGLATHMLQVLFDWARMHGVREVVGDILPENERMLRLARQHRFSCCGTRRVIRESSRRGWRWRLPRVTGHG